jgi:hypothetical protein
VRFRLCEASSAPAPRRATGDTRYREPCGALPPAGSRASRGGSHRPGWAGKFRHRGNDRSRRPDSIRRTLPCRRVDRRDKPRRPGPQVAVGPRRVRGMRRIRSLRAHRPEAGRVRRGVSHRTCSVANPTHGDSPSNRHRQAPAGLKREGSETRVVHRAHRRDSDCKGRTAIGTRTQVAIPTLREHDSRGTSWRHACLRGDRASPHAQEQ